MTPNADLFVSVLAQIEREPELWMQGSFAKQTNCGTACCFAGHAVVLCGFVPDFSTARRCLTLVGEPLQTNVLTDGRMIDETAEVLLGFDDTAHSLFSARNTLDDLYRISAEILGIDETVLRDKVAAEVADGAVQ